MSKVLVGGRNIPVQTWDIDQSIPELAYLTHNFFRYYGKFPSVLAAKLIEEYGVAGSAVLDNYAGSGTTLVEAKLAGFSSIGVDINPLGILACKVKVRVYSVEGLVKKWRELHQKVEEHYSFLFSADGDSIQKSKSSYAESKGIAESYIPKSSDIDKWFTERAKYDLGILKSCIAQMQADEYREFFVLAFIGIIRRVSRAYDGEIRPHVNKDKKPRNVWHAYAKKVNEMIERERGWVLAVKRDVDSFATVGDNRQLSSIPQVRDANIGLVISHPPYLNSFDYFPAFKLQLQWAEGFEETFPDAHVLKKLRKQEIRAWPATDSRIYNDYFDNQRLALQEIYQVLRPGGICCLVIGDSTIKGELIPVHLNLAEIAEDLGFDLQEIIYRTTHYGVGKYAYQHRADYHGGSEKKDGVLILRKRT